MSLYFQTQCNCTLNRLQYISFIGIGKPKKKCDLLYCNILLWWSGAKSKIALRYVCSTQSICNFCAGSLSPQFPKGSARGGVGGSGQVISEHTARSVVGRNSEKLSLLSWAVRGLSIVSEEDIASMILESKHACPLIWRKTLFLTSKAIQYTISFKKQLK